MRSGVWVVRVVRSGFGLHNWDHMLNVTTRAADFFLQVRRAERDTQNATHLEHLVLLIHLSAGMGMNMAHRRENGG